MKPSEKARKNREQILEIASRYKAKNVRLFGSAARGDDSEQSDLDLLIELPETASLFDIGGIKYYLEEALNISVDVMTIEDFKEKDRKKILNEVVAL